jgi:hypothetical protein
MPLSESNDSLGGRIPLVLSRAADLPPTVSEENPMKLTKRLDWRGWVILAWVLGFGALYAKMVVELRGGKLRAVVGATKAAPSPERGAP